MKCVCGYEYRRVWKQKDLDVGDEEFIHIDGMFRVKNTGHFSGDHACSLYACPKCNTIQLAD